MTVWPQILYWMSAWICAMIGFAWISNYHKCDSWGWSGHSFLSKPLAKQLSQYTLFSAICKPFEPNIDFYQNPDLGWKFPTLPWDKKEGVSSKRDVYHLLVSDVHKKKSKKKKKTQKEKTTKKERKRKKRKGKNQSI